MKIQKCIKTIVIFLIVVTLIMADARKCRRADRKAGKCASKKDRRGRKSRSSPKTDVAPQWRKRPPKDDKIIVREGTELSLSCSFKGSPRPAVSWNMNGRELDAKRSSRYRMRRAKLLIKDVEIKDSATYTCIGKNKAGSLRFSYSVKVLENMPLNDIDVVDRPDNQTAQVGDTVIFMCRSHDWPKPKVFWQRKTETGNAMEVLKITKKESDVLVLHNVKKEDTGVYTCVMSNDEVVKELPATLKVIDEGESLPFEPACSLHIKRQVFYDHAHGCRTAEPVEMHYCMGSCGRSYYIPQMLTSDDLDSQTGSGLHLNQTCRCCIGIVDRLRIVELDCPLGKKKRGFYTLLRECQCQDCSTPGHLLSSTAKPRV